MAKFFVGQRVKVKSVGHPSLQFLLGAEAVVNEIGCDWYSEHGEEVDGVGVTIDGRDDWAFFPYQLEPILPEGAAPSIYSYQELMDKLREGERV